MAQAIKDHNVPDANSLQNRIVELETVMRTVLQQIDTHQVYDKDARTLIRRTLGTSKQPASSPTSSRASEFPSMFPSASPQNFL